MSYILALETATTACSAALCAADGSVVAEALSLDGPAHAGRLLPGVYEVFEVAGVTWDEISAVVVGLGPGAFTGLRIGIATARALAQADGRMGLLGVPTAAALALALANTAEAAGRLLVPLIDGRRREVFAAVYASGPGGIEVVEEVATVKADDLDEWLARLGAVVVGGDGAVLYADRLPASALPASGMPDPDGSHDRPCGGAGRARPRLRSRRGAAYLRPRPGRGALGCAGAPRDARAPMSGRLDVVPPPAPTTVRRMQFTDLEAVVAIECRSYENPWPLGSSPLSWRERPASTWSSCVLGR